MSAARLVVLLALRSLLAHRTKSALVGGLLLLSTFALVVGSALLGSVERAMESCITRSMAGHLQVYDADARDPLGLFGAFRTMGSTEVGEIPAIEEVVPELERIPGVSAVVPEGITLATVLGRNELDQASADLRDALRDGGHTAALVERLRRSVGEGIREAGDQDALLRADAIARTREAVTHVGAPGFWSAFEPGGDALGALDYLDTRIAPLSPEGRVVYLRLLGTDPERFTAAFDRMHLVRGRPIPEGQPGLLLSERVYQELVKDPVAVALDHLRQASLDGASLRDPALREEADRNAAQFRRITHALDPDEAREVEAWLRTELPGVDGDLDALVRSFLTVDDRTIESRWTGFYAHLAPKIALYAIPVGSTVTLRGFTRSGYLKAVQVPVYGTFEFTGLEQAGFQTATNLIDLVTFRELYGRMSDRDRAELDQIRVDAGVADVNRADAEAALFGGGTLEVEATPVGRVALDRPASIQDPWTRSYPRSELERGLALNLAVVLADPDALPNVTPAVRQVAEAHGLQVVDWREAAGVLGQFVVVMQLVLGVSVALILVVALIIVNNAMVMATLDRVPEIGTLRAIGAGRGTILGLFLTETAMLGLLAGALGAGLAVALIAGLGVVGLPAPTPVLVLVFGGARLYPQVGVGDVAFGVATITLSAVASAVYPAILAARVRPIVAMQAQD